VKNSKPNARRGEPLLGQRVARETQALGSGCAQRNVLNVKYSGKGIRDARH
jgi:hypothetical protein